MGVGKIVKMFSLLLSNHIYDLKVLTNPASAWLEESAPLASEFWMHLVLKDKWIQLKSQSGFISISWSMEINSVDILYLQSISENSIFSLGLKNFSLIMFMEKAQQGMFCICARPIII